MSTIVKLNKRKLLTVPPETEITEEIVEEAIKLHREQLLKSYKKNEAMYMSDHDILHGQAKEVYKPDNRLVVNFAKYIVDTFVGYQIGIPVKITHKDSKVTDFITNFRKMNDMEDSEFELAKLADIFGHSFIYLYQDENSKTCMTYESPMNMVIVHEGSVKERPLFAIRYSIDDTEEYNTGEVITRDKQTTFLVDKAGDVAFGEETSHIYNDLPVVELIENEERQGLFDSVQTLINALNKALSEKANDVDYFADAYLKVLGVEMDDETAVFLRDSRIINLFSTNEKAKLDVGFLEKPNADTTQENLIALLVKSIFDISMVANLANEDFGNSSGTALAFKLQPMSNLAQIKDRKMQSAFNRMYRLVFDVPLSGIAEDAWTGIEYKFARNVPRNILEEAQVIQALDGQVSDETKLSVLSIIQDVPTELERLKKEEEASSKLAQRMLPDERLTDGEVVADEKQE